MANDKPYRILALEGGGVRGLLSAIWLNRLEQKLGTPIKEHFDIVAGTSTGALIGCALSLGIKTEVIVNLYLNYSREIFPEGGARLASRLRRSLTDGISAPRYDGVGLQNVLQRVFQNALFRDLQVKPTLVTSYDTLRREAVVFKNTKPTFDNIPVWEICKASASAPVYFPAHIMQVEGKEVPLIDGGVVANNPTACAIAEGVRMNEALPPDQRVSLSNFVVASFGTGEVTRPISIKESQEWGALEWALPLINVLFDGSADAVNYISKYLLSDSNYFRFQTPLRRAFDDLDNADPANLDALVRTAQEYLAAEGDALLDQLVTAITPR